MSEKQGSFLFIALVTLFGYIYIRNSRKPNPNEGKENKDKSDTKTITILHFNDVYEIETQPGAARFVASLDAYQQKREKKAIVLFSGDAFNPSTLSIVTKGDHMIPVLNRSYIKAACPGNHDFDFGIDKFIELKNACNFPWLLSNVLDRKSKRSLANCLRSEIIEHDGIKIGLFGLAEKEWLETLNTISIEDVIFLDYIETADKISKELKEQGAQLIIALTHMRFPNDMKLAKNCQGKIDLILGGHDHDCIYERVGDTTHFIKSGCDFRFYTEIHITLKGHNDPKLFAVNHLEVDKKGIQAPDVLEATGIFSNQLKKQMSSVVGHTSIDLECRFSKVRTSETNLGNYVADVVRNFTQTDVCVINSGTLRADRILPKGQITMGDMLSLLPFPDAVSTLQLNGLQLLQTLENSVSVYPTLEGRFPILSGVSFSFDPTKEVRVIKDSVLVGGEKIVDDKIYSVSTKHYLVGGKDGYTSLANGVIINEDVCDLRELILENLKILSVLQHFADNLHKHHVRTNSLDLAVKKFHNLSKFNHGEDQVPLSPHDKRNHYLLQGKDGGDVKYSIHPLIEGRIVCINKLI